MDKQKLNRILWGFMALMFLAVGLMLMSNLRRIPHISLPSEDVSEDHDTQGPTSSENALNVIEIRPTTVQAAVATLSRPETYRRTITVEQIWSTGSAETKLNVSVSGKLTKIVQTLADGQIRHTLTDGEFTYIWYNEDKNYFSGPAGDISADQEQMIPTYEDILNLPQDSITVADYENYSDIYCIFVETAPNMQGYTMRYWISVDSGLLVAAERIFEDECVYRMTALTLDAAVPIETDFQLPDGKAL